MASLSQCCFASSFTSRNSYVRRSNSKPKFSCKASHEPVDQDQHLGSRVDRRNMLIGLGSAATGLGMINRDARAQPIMAPDLSKCSSAESPAPAGLNCCPPYQSNTTIVDFKPPGNSTPLRIRPAAQLVTPEYLAKYEKAVELMKALPADDPRNFHQQANVHCAYCNGGYDQIKFPSLKIQVHNSWVFFPWHRFYLYFHERILGKLIGDDSFALPYWNWDAPDGMMMPALYSTDPSSSLYDELRNAKHQRPTVINLDFSPAGSPTLADAQLIDQNLKVMYRQVISNGKTAELYMGSPYRAGGPANPGPGSLENVPHGSVHVWTGDSTQPNGEDMGTLYSAARDPIFYAHHSNIDRLWSVWKTLGGKHKDFKDKDWLETSFLFYDENAQLVRVKVKDCLDSEVLGYKYQEVDLPWLKARPTPNAATATKKPLLKSRAIQVEPSFPLALKSAVSVTVQRPKVNRSKKEKEEVEEEVLLIDEIEYDHNEFIKFDVFINTPDHEGVGPGSSEFAGSFVNVPHMHNARVKTKLRLGITDLIEDLEADADETLRVTLVPKAGNVTIGGARIEFSSLK